MGTRAFALIAVTALLACAPVPDAAGRTVRIEMIDFAYRPKEITLVAGERVTLELANKGLLAHEIMVGRGSILHDGGYEDDLLREVEMTLSGHQVPDHSHGGAAILVAKGRTARATFTVPDRPGSYELGCFEPGHYLAGMVGRLVITPRP